MSGVSVDTSWLKQLHHAPKHIERAAMLAAKRTNRWLLLHARSELKIELNIKGINNRFKPFHHGANGQSYTSKLWVGTNDLAVHKFGQPVQLDGSTVRVGEDEYDNAFIRYVGNTPIVYERYAPHASTAGARRQIRAVTKPISEETKAIIDALTPQIDAKFKEFFDDELKSVLAKSI
ncbi:hypothetical protein [Vibrio splendidus]|uniref:hypothetical protein n=1 Tax=Vibrio splendidus TaxID=29497 RepID=UPI000C84C566|nr:hypothetical protein [Vibrio splendidus]PMI49568.1 hypothetical protein BCU42_14325 [Vibrio splendidus]